MKISIFQPACPDYRIPFFNNLYKHYGKDFKVYYSLSNMGLGSNRESVYPWQKSIGRLYKPLPGIEWQTGILNCYIKKDDLIVICGNPRNLSTLLLIIKSRFYNIPVIWWGQYWGANSTQLSKNIRMLIAMITNGILFYTDNEVTAYLKYNPRNSLPISALNNGVSNLEIKKLREKYEINNRMNQLLFIGRLTNKSNFLILLEAINILKRTRKIKLNIIGAIKSNLNIKELIKQFNIEDNIIFHGESTDEKFIAKIANSCSVFVYPGQVGLSLIHAMAYGLPAIIHNNKIKHMPEIAAFTEDSTGYSFKEGSSRSLANTIDRILNDSIKLKKMSSNSLKIIDKTYNTNNMAKRFIDFCSYYK